MTTNTQEINKIYTRPWGSYKVLNICPENTYQVKEIIVTPGSRLSYQKHYKRAEHWYIISGQAIVTLDGQDHELNAGDSINIKLEQAHRIANPGNSEELKFIEIQTGSYFGEDDIVRLQDDYDRK